jgi:hypothetical protein
MFSSEPPVHLRLLRQCLDSPLTNFVIREHRKKTPLAAARRQEEQRCVIFCVSLVLLRSSERYGAPCILNRLTMAFHRRDSLGR